MFFVTDGTRIVARSRSVNSLLKILAREYPDITLIETAARNITLPRGLRLNYISR